MAAILDAFSGLMLYRHQRALYEADCRVRQECAKLREAVYRHDSEKDRVTVAELALCKQKLKRLRQDVDGTEGPLKELFMPLLSALETRIQECRKTHVGVRLIL